MKAFVPLLDIARATLGYKSLQNNFFYLRKETIDTYGIEVKYLKPLFMLKDLSTTEYLQTSSPQLWLLHCSEEERDLRGTGAHRYIQTMSGRSAAERKQTGVTQTIRQALEAQGGSRWYSPKATPHRHRLWLRKAFSGIYAPFVFSKATLVDQRCNALAPLQGIPWDSLAAVVTSSLFAYSLEINGSASMGAGALEASTSRLRSYPVLDVRTLSAAEHKELQRLAHAVWAGESPVDWIENPTPGKLLCTLDQWVLHKAGDPISLTTLYEDLRTVSGARIVVAKDKTRKTKKHKSESIGSVAKGIADFIRKLLEARRFPDDFCAAGDPHLDIRIDPAMLRHIELRRFMHTADLRLAGNNSETLFEANLDWSVAEAVVRALLAGRTEFAVNLDPTVAETAVREFLKWFDKIREEVEKGIANSALGTGYEDQLTAEVYKMLGLHPLVAQSILPPVIGIARS